MNNFKYIFIIAFGIILLSSCKEDKIVTVVVEEDNIDTIFYVNDTTYTLSENDYDLINNICGCTEFGNFVNISFAKSNIPLILSTHFYDLIAGSSVLATYNLYNGSSPDLRGTYTEVTVPAADYDLFHGYDTFDNFNNADEDVVDWINWKGITGKDGDYIDVTFDYYDDALYQGEVSRIVFTVAYGWQYVWQLPDDVYGDFFLETGIDFSYSDEGKEKISTYLNYLLANANDYFSLSPEEGTIRVVQFNYDDNGLGTVPDVAMYLYNGTEWMLYSDAYQITDETLLFGHDGTKWIADNTINYSLSSNDYVSIGTTFSNSNPTGSSSMLFYGNFDLALWTTDQILEAIAGRLLDISEIVKADGQKYLVSYATWEPGAGNGTLYVIYSATEGAFIVVE